MTVDGKKVGKSLGNAITADALIARFGLDALRYYLLRHVGSVNDGDVDQARLLSVYEGELADDLGNLVARSLALLKRRRAPSASDAPPALDARGIALIERASTLAGEVDEALERFATEQALQRIWTLVLAANKYVGDAAPWTVAKARDAATSDAPRARLDEALDALLSPLARALEVIASELEPFLPGTSRAIQAALLEPAKPVPLLFPKEKRA